MRKHPALVALIACVLAALGVTALLSASKPDTLARLTAEGPRLVMFYQRDCVPCRAEMMLLPKIRESLPPASLRVVSLARPDATLARAVDADEVIDMSGGEGEDLLRSLSHGRLALPFSFAVGRGGKICATHEGILGLQYIQEWQDTCWK